MNIYSDSYNSPVGQLCIEATDKGITKVSRIKEPMVITQETNEHIRATQGQLDEYFRGERKEFTVETDLDGYTDFYQKVWKALLDIPYGQTSSYINIARQIGDIKSVRAVGMANGKNPVGIIIPCHRVIGANGKLVGYAGGIDMKKWLLLHERSFSPVPAHLLF